MAHATAGPQLLTMAENIPLIFAPYQDSSFPSQTYIFIQTHTYTLHLAVAILLRTDGAFALNNAAKLRRATGF